ncbi:MAG TPA: response regulator [Vicinamibacterales bacterium]|jgi:DNA-binding NtrC family response regulator
MIVGAEKIPDMGRQFPPPARILVVDDETLIRWALNQRLSSAGYHVDEAKDGASALAYFRAGEPPIDLVLLDLKLPDVDGVTLLKMIKRRSPLCRVILMTAFGTAETLQEARNNGVNDVLAKPFDLELAVKAVERAWD